MTVTSDGERPRPAVTEPPLSVLADQPRRGKEPNSVSVLDKWIQRAQHTVGVEPGRLGWLVASTVVIAALQRAVDETGASRFLLKGGTYLQYRLGVSGRPTKDVDGLIRGDLDEFLQALDAALQLPWGAIELARTEVDVINAPSRVAKPRRFYVKLTIKGRVWRSIKVEIAPDEGGAGAEHDVLPAPALEYFGLPNPTQLLGIAVRFQVAQKLHACSDPHDPPAERNDRARDVVDLLLLRDLIGVEGFPTPVGLRAACIALFDARAADARHLDRVPRDWPPVVVAYPHWEAEFPPAARQGGVELTLADAVSELNAWVGVIAQAEDPLA